jgi:hypothetical protein
MPRRTPMQSQSVPTIQDRLSRAYSAVELARVALRGVEETELDDVDRGRVLASIDQQLIDGLTELHWLESVAQAVLSASAPDDDQRRAIEGRS